MMQVELTDEHRWLERMVGEWTYETKGENAGAPEEAARGTESVRSLGGVWIVAEGHGTMPDGDPATTLITLGYDTTLKRFVGTFVASMMTKLWTYDGELDESGQKLSLYSDGPDFTDPSKTRRYCDAIEFKSDDHRVFTATVQGEDGEWHSMMTAHYHRKR